jgi:hypothetical protein
MKSCLPNCGRTRSALPEGQECGCLPFDGLDPASIAPLKTFIPTARGGGEVLVMSRYSQSMKFLLPKDASFHRHRSHADVPERGG